MLLLGIPWWVWVLAGLGFLILRTILINKPMEPTEANVTRILRLYDNGQNSQTSFRIYETSQRPDSIGFYGVVASFKRQFGDSVRWQDNGNGAQERPEDWPVYVAFFSRRPYKLLILTHTRFL